jgi:hypothetical protein
MADSRERATILILRGSAILRAAFPGSIPSLTHSGGMRFKKSPVKQPTSSIVLPGECLSHRILTFFQNGLSSDSTKRNLGGSHRVPLAPIATSMDTEIEGDTPNSAKGFQEMAFPRMAVLQKSGAAPGAGQGPERHFPHKQYIVCCTCTALITALGERSVILHRLLAILGQFLMRVRFSPRPLSPLLASIRRFALTAPRHETKCTPLSNPRLSTTFLSIATNPSTDNGDRGILPHLKSNNIWDAAFPSICLRT